MDLFSASKQISLDDVLNAVKGMKVDLLANAGVNIVISRGNPNAKFLFVGEAPRPVRHFCVIALPLKIRCLPGGRAAVCPLSFTEESVLGRTVYFQGRLHIVRNNLLMRPIRIFQKLLLVIRTYNNHKLPLSQE